jgi:demethylmenaquinone methyltransferase/2-methoxy-6-polyprenyl-1,4-benzoquinol methylase
MIPTEPAINPGARPTNETSETDAAAHVQSIFNSIAPSYDLLNHLLSMGLDRRWWSRSARAVRDILARPESRVLDLCCGTGDMTAALLKLRPRPTTQPSTSSPQSSGAPFIRRSLADEWDTTNSNPANTSDVVPITGLDFSAHMLDRARIKYASANAIWVEGDAMHLPYPDNSFDLVTAAFGFRNLTNYAVGLAEIHRVLAPNGRIAILEANQPDGLSGFLYTIYFRHILPIVGGAISGDRAAYKYLPASVARFPRPPQMLAMLSEAGFTNPTWQGYLLRAAGLYLATKP